MPLFIPPPIRRSQYCARCGQQFPKKAPDCSHCSTLSDREVEALRSRLEEERSGHSNIGRLFLFLAVMIAVAMLLLLL